MRKKKTTSNNLPEEEQYPDLAEYLRAGGKVTIGENKRMGSFAHIQIGAQIRAVETMDYNSIADVLKDMNEQARVYMEESW